jgi:hypothetical protein
MLWYIQRYLILIEALNLVLEKIFSRNPAAWQYHSAFSLYTTEFYTEICHGLPLEIYITSYELQMLLQLTVAWLSIFAQTVGMTSAFKLQPQCKTSSLAPFSS